MIKAPYPRGFAGMYGAPGYLAVVLGIVLAAPGCVPYQPVDSWPQPTQIQPPLADSAASENPFQNAIEDVGEHCYKGRKTLATDLPTNRLFTTSLPTVLVAFNDITPSVISHSPGKTLLLAQGSPLRTQKKLIPRLEQLGKLVDIQAASFDKDKLELLLIGSAAVNGQGLVYDDWLTVFRAKSALGVSIDPGQNPDVMDVRYFGGIEQTHVGSAFFEADRTLKLLSTGFDNLNCSRFTRMPSVIRTELELMEAEVRQSRTTIESSWHRFWFEPSDERIEVTPDGLSMSMPPRRLVVKEELLFGKGWSLESSKEFSRLVSDNFLELATQIPAFAELQRQSALVVLKKWMTDSQIPADKQWVANSPKPVHTPSTTPSITVTRATIEDRSYVQVGIYGGVDFQKPNRYMKDKQFVNPLLRAAAEAAEKRASWDFEFEGRKYRAVRLRYEEPIALGTPEPWERSTGPSLPLPKPRLLAFPSLEEVSREYSGTAEACPQLSPNADIVVRGDAYVWDKTKTSVDEALNLIPEPLRASSHSGQLTLFLIHDRGQEQVGTYDISGQPAYRENLTVSVRYWPQGTCVGTIRIDGGPPPSVRPVQYVPGYGTSVKLAEWISELRSDK